MNARLARRIAAVLLALPAIGFGIPAAIGIGYRARTGSTWHLWGFPTHLAGGFNDWGVYAPIQALTMVFVGICTLATAAAVLLWFERTMLVGAVAGLALIAAQGIFWFGFELPFGPPGGVLAVAAIIAALVLRARERRV